MNVKNSIPQCRTWSLKLHVAPNNGGSPFFGTLQCEEKKDIIHSRIIPAIKALPKEP